MFATFYKNTCEGDSNYKFMGFKKPNSDDFFVYPLSKNLGMEIRHAIIIQFPVYIFNEFMLWHNDSDTNHFCLCDMDTFKMTKIDKVSGNNVEVGETIGVKIDIQARFDYEQAKYKKENNIK